MSCRAPKGNAGATSHEPKAKKEWTDAKRAFGSELKGALLTVVVLAIVVQAPAFDSRLAHPRAPTTILPLLMVSMGFTNVIMALDNFRASMKPRYDHTCVISDK